MGNEEINNIIIENVGNDLRVRGQTGLGFRFRVEGSDPVEVIKDQATQTVTIRGTGDDCELLIADGCQLHILNVGSDAKITNLEESVISIENVASDLVLKNVGKCQVGNVGSDLVAKNIMGDFGVGNVGSDLSIRGVTGNVTIEHVGSDLSVRDVEGNCICQVVTSDLVVAIQFTEGHTYQFGAGADIVFQIREGDSARFIMPKTVKVHSSIRDLVETQEGDQRIVKLGQGTPDVVITHANRVIFAEQQDKGFNFDFEFDFNGLGENINTYVGNLEAQIHQNLGNIEDIIAQSMETAAEQVNRHADRFRRRSQQREAERIQRQAQRAQQKAERFQRRFIIRDQKRPEPVAPSWEPISAQERRMILDMVAQGRLSVEEAEKLLRTLDGSSG